MKRLLAGVVLTAVMAAPAIAAGDPAAGKAKSVICAACHGADGIATIPSYPNLKGQNAQYLISALKAYQTKARTGAMAQVMQPMAGILNDQDIANLAAYYSQLK